MTEFPQIPEQGNNPSPANPPVGKSQAGKKPKTVKGAYGKMSIRLLRDHEHALRLASIILERAGDQIHTPQQMVDEAITRYTDYLQVKKGIDFQGIIPKKIVPAK